MLPQMALFHSFLCLSSIPLYGDIFYIYMDKYIYLWIHSTPTFFIHSFVDGHFDCFHILAIVNSAAYEHWDHAYFFFFYIYTLYLFLHFIIYFWLHWVFVAACRLSVVAVQGLLTAVASLDTGCRHMGFSNCSRGAHES